MGAIVDSRRRSSRLRSTGHVLYSLVKDYEGREQTVMVHSSFLRGEKLTVRLYQYAAARRALNP